MWPRSSVCGLSPSESLPLSCSACGVTGAALPVCVGPPRTEVVDACVVSDAGPATADPPPPPSASHGGTPTSALTHRARRLSRQHRWMLVAASVRTNVIISASGCRLAASSCLRYHMLLSLVPQQHSCASSTIHRYRAHGVTGHGHWESPYRISLVNSILVTWPIAALVQSGGAMRRAYVHMTAPTFWRMCRRAPNALKCRPRECAALCLSTWIAVAGSAASHDAGASAIAAVLSAAELGTSCRAC